MDRRSPYPGGGELPEIYYRTLDPFVALTAAAVVTERLLLGTGVALVAQRDPVITAKEVASLDLVSGGRAVFGVGVGWNREEMENHGTDPATRGRLVDERLRRSGSCGRRRRPNSTGSSSTSTRSTRGPSRCSGRIRRSTWAAARPPSTGSPSSVTPGSPTAASRRAGPADRAVALPGGP